MVRRAPAVVDEVHDAAEQRVDGGGTKGQAEAIKLGISRALCNMDVEMRVALKPAGLLTRDPRVVERKKFGHKKARRSYQFSKR